MWLVYNGQKETTGLKILSTFVSLGVPDEIGRVGRHTWGIKYDNLQTAQDALWVLRKHPRVSKNIMGEGEWKITNNPPEFTHTQQIRGRAEA